MVGNPIRVLVVLLEVLHIFQPIAVVHENRIVRMIGRKQRLARLALSSSVRPQMAIQRIHASECALTTLANIRPQIEMKMLVAFAVVLPCEALITARPLALEGPLLVVRTEMPLQVEMSGESAPTARDRADEVSLRAPAPLASVCSRVRRHVLARDVQRSSAMNGRMPLRVSSHDVHICAI